MALLAYQTGPLANTRERVKDLYYRVEAINQSPIALTIFFERLLPFFE